MFLPHNEIRQLVRKIVTPIGWDAVTTNRLDDFFGHEIYVRRQMRQVVRQSLAVDGAKSHAAIQIVLIPKVPQIFRTLLQSSHKQRSFGLSIFNRSHHFRRRCFRGKSAQSDVQGPKLFIQIRDLCFCVGQFGLKLRSQPKNTLPNVRHIDLLSFRSQSRHHILPATCEEHPLFNQSLDLLFILLRSLRHIPTTVHFVDRRLHHSTAELSVVTGTHCCALLTASVPSRQRRIGNTIAHATLRQTKKSRFRPVPAKVEALLRCNGLILGRLHPQLLRSAVSEASHLEVAVKWEHL
mmetsp:Transcript_23546/g.50342  ORF Transcript_23546/g.50342 Transcript_23546/m.50342 type:complete len:294 (+) Transcript_23546:573-1454(+)